MALIRHARKRERQVDSGQNKSTKGRSTYLATMPAIRQLQFRLRGEASPK